MIDGTNIGLKDDGTVRFFDQLGWAQHADRWRVSSYTGSLPESAIEPFSTLKMIRELFAFEAERQTADKVDTLALNPLMAAGLFMEGVLTEQHLESAIEDTIIDCVTIPELVIDGHKLRVLVMRNIDPCVQLVHKQPVS